MAQPKDLMAPDSEVAVLDTSLGKIVIEFFPNAAPNHVANFKKLARSGFYNGTQFHRVIPDFMIQGGDPNSKDSNFADDGTGTSGTKLKAEFSSIPHKRGIVSMARPADPNGASCQFFIVHKDSPHLDNQYSVFGQVIEGMDTVDKIAAVKTGARDHPITPVIVKKVTIEKRSASTTPGKS
jgi:cyclophilin family peptidyl-prolyl cis-trans isomerase